MLVLREHEVSAVLDIDAALEAVRRAQFAVYAGHGEVLAKGRARAGDLTLHAVGGSLDADGTELAGVKSYVSGSTRAHWVLLFDGRHGLRALVAADRLGRLRTGAASAVATEALARPDATALTLFGAGRQAFTQVEALSRVRRLSGVAVVSRTESHARAMAERIRSELRLPAEVALDPVAAVATADIVVTITTAREPVLQAPRSPPART